jgi:hypothetical protein
MGKQVVDLLEVIDIEHRAGKRILPGREGCMCRL